MKGLLILGLCIFSLQSFAVSDKGNGGDGLWINGKLYSLDLVEAGVEKAPYFDSNVPNDPFIYTRVSQKLNKEIFPVNLISAKLSEIQTVDKLFATIILKGIELYQWRMVNSSLIDIKDERSALNFPKKDLVQLASRSLNSILIDRALWNKLDDKNKTALIFHEVLYALAPLEHTRDLFTGDFERNPLTGQYTGSQFQSSPVARQVTGYIFTSEFSRSGISELVDLGFRISGGTGPMLERKDDSTITYGDYIFLTGSHPQFQNYNNWINYGVKFDFSDDKINQYATEACEIAVAAKSDLKFVWAHSTHKINFGTYRTKADQKTYLETSGKFRPLETRINTSNREVCIKEARLLINDRITNIKENYR